MSFSMLFPIYKATGRILSRQLVPANGQVEKKQKEWTGEYSNGKIITENVLNTILDEHKKWLKTYKKDGKKADLRKATLFGVDLGGANLSKYNQMGPHFFHVKLSGAYLDQANLSKAILIRANLVGVSLSKADLSEAYLREAKLSGAYLANANISKAIFDNANLSGAFLHGSNLSRATFIGANLSGAYLDEANLSGATMFKANLSQAILSSTDLRGADLHVANLSGANLSGANLSGANLKEADLKECIFDSNTQLPFFYEPKAGSPPYIPSIANLPSLSMLTYKKSPHGLVDLREGFKKMGYRKQEREITYAIKHTQMCQLLNDPKILNCLKKEDIDYKNFKGKIDRQKFNTIWIRLEGLFHLIFFELTCEYGMSPGRPLKILIFLIPFFSFLYIFGLKTRKKKTGIWIIFLEKSVLKATKEERPFKLTAKFPPRTWPADWPLGLIIIIRSYRILRLAFYFSLLSATTIGWREINVGNWLSRLQRSEYTLRATGWVRTVSGLQSLISVYLLALWALTYFGRPFESV